MNGGYMGKVLYVDLSTGTIKEEQLDDQTCRDFIGGYGLASRIIYSRQRPGADALGPDNILGLVSGPLTGTPVPTGARYAVVGKSPLTGGWGDANSGGDFGPYLKFAGFDAVFFTGISPSPVYLLLDNGKAELKDASALWGKDSYETEDALMAEYGKQTRVACIGPSGESLSLISCVMTDRGSAAGRSGLGAVMGSKRLKAVAARGTLPVALANKAEVDRQRMDLIKSLQTPRPPSNMSQMERMHKYGTSSITYNSAHTGDTPVKNWGGVGVVDFPDKSMLHEEVVAKSVARLSGCWHCPIACKAVLNEGPGEYKYAAGSRRPEYETAASFGLCSGNTNMEAINMANDICNRAGLDTISAGTAVAFAIECFENGILTRSDTDGIDLRWGNHQAMVAITGKLARREGLGDLLADGVKVAAQKIGRGAEKFAVHVGGQEVGMHDPKLISPRGGFNIASYQLDATPGRHTAGFGPSSFGKHITNSCGVCYTGFGFGGAPDTPQRLADFLRAVAGMDITTPELVKAGERIANMRHAFNLREGINQLKWFVHPRILGTQPLTVGPLAGVTIDAPPYIYWNLGALDWDRVTTKPSKAKLLSLGLSDVAADTWPDTPPPPPR
jgi:aldehyde:ferredoxin oxidoreductase